MSAPDPGKSVKTLAIRLEPEMHAMLSLIAQLRESTLTDEIRAAIEAHIAALHDNPELAAKADTALEEVEREAAAGREAIATLFGNNTPKSKGEEPKGRSRKPSASQEPATA